MLLDRVGVVAGRLFEERSQLIRKLRELLTARPQQRKNGGRPAVSPQAPSPRPQAPEPRHEFFVREANQVLMIEPIELVGIEHGVAAADRLEIESLNQFLAREQLVVAA